MAGIAGFSSQEAGAEEVPSAGRQDALRLLCPLPHAAEQAVHGEVNSHASREVHDCCNVGFAAWAKQSCVSSPRQRALLVCVPWPQRLEQLDQGVASQLQPEVSWQSSVSIGASPSCCWQWEASPLGHWTILVRLPRPQRSEQGDQLLAFHLHLV
mmetsp:Transcript_90021/g.178992  ORF Transcript_90021/g.178992 Transcript_90021/m.178992 type:complete len:155 (-) Transcript_90021:1696-2160(-)